MTTKRWWLGSYEVQYNPKALEESQRPTANPIMTINGLTSNQNLFYDKMSNITIDVYNKPTSVGSSIATFSDGVYTGLTCTPISAYLLYPSGTASSFDVYSLSGGIQATHNIQPKNYVSGGTITNTATSGNVTNIETIDMLSSYTVSQIVVSSPSYSGNLVVQTSSDNVNYTTQYSANTSLSGNYNINFTPIGCRYIKVQTSGSTVSTQAKYIPQSVPYGIAQISGSSAIAIFYGNDRGNASMLITDENGNEIRKYVFSGVTDLRDVTHIASDNNSTIYAVNKYGEIITINADSGLYHVSLQTSDFLQNQSSNKAIYSGIHYTQGLVGIVVNNSKIQYYDATSFNLVNAVDIPIPFLTAVDIWSPATSGTCYMMTDTQLLTITPNMARAEIEQIKAQAGVGFITITNESNMSKQMIVKNISMREIRNLAESRFEVSISGQFI